MPTTSDLERLRQLLNSWGVPYHESDWKPGESSPDSIYAQHPQLHSVTVGGLEYDWDSEKIHGYSGFFTGFEFTPDGEFVSMGAWE